MVDLNKQFNVNTFNIKKFNILNFVFKSLDRSMLKHILTLICPLAQDQSNALDIVLLSRSLLLPYIHYIKLILLLYPLQ